jgi:ATP-dependent DNA helicase RecG
MVEQSIIDRAFVARLPILHLLPSYDDRLEIARPSPLPFGQTPPDLMKPHPSQPWDPLIATVCYRWGLIERWGRGTLKMAELTHQAGLPPPEIEATASEVIVRFRPTRYVLPSRIGHDLTDLQRQILDILAQAGSCPLSTILGHLPPGTVHRTVQRSLKLLQQLGLVELSGERRWARWALKGAPDRRA